MRLSEFADRGKYVMSSADMEKLVKRMERVWRDFGVKADAPVLLRLINEPKDVRQLLADGWRRRLVRARTMARSRSAR